MHLFLDIKHGCFTSLKYWLVSIATIETNGNHFCLHLAGADDSIVNLS